MKWFVVYYDLCLNRGLMIIYWGLCRGVFSGNVKDFRVFNMYLGIVSVLREYL